MPRHRLPRRAISIPALVVVAVVVVVGLPAWLIVGAVVDLAGRRWRWPTVRLVAFTAAALVIELVGLARVTVAWFRAGIGRGLRGVASQRHHQLLEYWYLRSLYTVARRTLGLRIEVDPASPPMRGGAIVIGRHTSYGDAALPALLAADGPDLKLRYVLARGLQWSPCFDIVGNRLPNHFVDRAAADLDAVGDLGAGLDEDTLVAIFPEGTFHSPARHARRVERLRSSDPALADRAAALRHLLPPGRPARSLCSRPRPPPMWSCSAMSGSSRSPRSPRSPARSPSPTRSWCRPGAMTERRSPTTGPIRSSGCTTGGPSSTPGSPRGSDEPQ